MSEHWRSGCRACVALRFAALVLVVAHAGACNLVGPRALRSGRSLYNEAVADTANEQVLLNLVRLRYRDVTVFLEIASLSTTYTLDTSVSSSLLAGVEIGSSDAELSAFETGGGLGYSERPTITMVPLQGEQFATRLLTPIRPGVIALLSNSGWAIDRILAMTVQQLGPLANAPSASGPTPDLAPAYSEFQRFAESLRSLQRKHELTLALLENSANPDEPDIAIEFPAAARGEPEYAEALTLLGLEPEVGVDEPRRIVLTVSRTSQTPDAIPITTRSLISAMFYLSQGVEPTERDVERGVVTTTFYGDGRPFEWSAVLGNYFVIRSGDDLPRTAGPRVRYRGQWYWIDDSDLTSKSTLSIVHQLFALQSGKIDNVGPILTIPVAGG